MTVVTETWMPVSGRFREYPLQPEVQMWDYGIGIVAKGHHDPEVFIREAATEYVEEILGGELLEDETLPAWIDLKYVRHEWWATRVWGGGEYAYYVNPVAPWERGAYPVTVVDCG